MPSSTSRCSPIKAGAPCRQTADMSVFARSGKSAMYYRAPDLPQLVEPRKKAIEVFVKQLAYAHVQRNEWDEVFEWAVHRTEDGKYAYFYGIVTEVRCQPSLAKKLSRHAYFVPMDEEHPPRGPRSETIAAKASERRKEAEHPRRSPGLLGVSGTLTASDLAAAKEAPRTESRGSTKRPRGVQDDDVGSQPAAKKAKAAKTLGQLDSERKRGAEGPKGPEHKNERSALQERLYHEDHDLKQKRISEQKRRVDETSNVPEVQVDKSASKYEGSADEHIGNGAASNRDPAGRSNHDDKRADTTSARATARPPFLTFPDVFPPQACITERNVAIERCVPETLVTANLLGDTELSEPVVKLYTTLVQQRVNRMVCTGRSWTDVRNRRVTSKRIVVVPPSISRRLLQVGCRYPEAGIWSEDYADVLNAELVLMPIQLESDGHWMLISAYFDCCEVTLYDCFADESSSAAQDRLDAASQVIKSFCRGVRDDLQSKNKGRELDKYEHLDLHPDEIRFVGSTSRDSEWSSIPQLGADSKDSGVLICQAMDCVIREISPFWFEPRHIAHIRKMMAIECSNKMLLMRKTDR